MKSGASQICWLIYSVLMRAVTHKSVLRFSGRVGHVELFMKGDHFQPDCYREITWASPLAKLLTRPLVLRSLAGSSQFGGKLNGFTRLRLTAAMEAANLSKLSCGSLFVDPSAAFSSITSQIPWTTSLGDCAKVVTRMQKRRRSLKGSPPPRTGRSWEAPITCWLSLESFTLAVGFL